MNYFWLIFDEIDQCGGSLLTSKATAAAFFVFFLLCIVSFWSPSRPSLGLLAELEMHSATRIY